MFGGKRLYLLRQSYDLQVGTFTYTEGVLPFPAFAISYTVHASGRLDVSFACDDILANPVPFELAENNGSLVYKSYDLVPSQNVDKLKENVRFVCPGFPFKEIDLTNVVFADSSTVFIALFGARYELDKS
ncbi:hypothetical protein FOL47_002282 [Perkinsus chesapeaki]|uniref:Uncharacterized protein n=1 Tax=Perkinsus chesapeaki TaxID=330153 RepID=A0A7J6KQV0_PERCH|nr:hypothetical protein FOL47_002282 [Perkinsus chesapeaki]|mmetsp:Transcript_718/g.608  ORF Transcript_718/g.608 Transcript_718/m.608 type:complete len:130 (-) Transcript_718:121-510(-)